MPITEKIRASLPHSQDRGAPTHDALLPAVMAQDAREVSRLLAEGADPNVIVDPTLGETILFVAVDYSQTEVPGISQRGFGRYDVGSWTCRFLLVSRMSG